MKEGHLAFQGRISEAIPYFSTIGYKMPEFSNPFDFFLDILSDPLRTGASFYEDYCNNLKDSISGQAEQKYDEYKRRELTLEILNNRQINYFLEYWILLKRNSINYVRNKALFYTRVVNWVLFSAFIFPFYMGVKYSKNDSDMLTNFTGFTFVNCLIPFNNGMMTSLNIVPTIRPILKRESASKLYRISAFYFAMLTSLLINSVIFTTIWSPVFYFSGQTRMDFTHFIIFYSYIFFTISLGQVFGVLVSTLASDQFSMMFGPFIFVIFMIGSGYYRNIYTLPIYIRWFYHIDPYRYLLEIQMRNESFNEFTDGIADKLGYSMGTGYSLLILFGMFFSVIFVGLIFFKYKTAKF